MIARAISASLFAGSLLVTGQALAASGEELFNTACSACHAAGGVGTPGLAPPLDRPEFWKELGDKAPDYIAGVVTKGLNAQIKVNGESYAGMMMPPVAGQSDDDLAAITTWVLQTLGKTDKTVTPEDIKTARESNLTNDDLKAMRPKTE